MKRAISKIGHIKLSGLTGFLAFLLAAVLLPVSCQQDEVTTNARYATLELVPSLKQYQVANQTRALPDGFVPYNELISPPPLPLTTIGVFMMPQVTDAVPNPGIPSTMGKFIYREHTWSSTINVEEGKDYYIFGFMPKEDANVATIAPYNGNTANDFSSGVIMTINNLDVVKPADVCVIVGVKGYVPAAATGPLPAITDDVLAMDTRLGQFSYQGKSETEGNYVYLLLDHIYAGLRFRMRVVDQYAKLRTIVLKKLELKAYTENVKTVNVVVKLKANTDGTNPAPNPIAEEPVFTTNTTSETIAATTIYPLAESQTGITLPSGLKEGSTTEYNYTDFLACLAPSSCTEFDLISTYDVYDRKGNLIRANQTATNHFSDFNQLVRGELQSFEITVSPTYLYMLSEPDLDNPTFTINQ